MKNSSFFIFYKVKLTWCRLSIYVFMMMNIPEEHICLHWTVGLCAEMAVASLFIYEPGFASDLLC